MQLRPDVYRIGETVQITGNFFEFNGELMEADGIKITLKKPPPDNSIQGPFPLSQDNGEVFFELDPDIIGTWKVRLECTFPKSAVIESKFEVVPHK